MCVVTLLPTLCNQSISLGDLYGHLDTLNYIICLLKKCKYRIIGEVELINGCGLGIGE